jgi:hypothetical protein
MKEGESNDALFVHSIKTTMARIRKNSFFEALSGTLGKEIVIKQYADKTVVTRYPDMSKVQPSERQKVQRALVKEANAYASRIRRNPELRAEYEKNLAPGESVYLKALREFYAMRKEEGRKGDS